ncbi:tetratricopeptide repeat protein [Stigmatella erecta]|uniref:MJ0042 family finger-like domain-containing protein n=1 Tax=Stigmatella erecta TaxID=83460 RepID=A0A1I0JY69_9BACT|nr:tetratricopeptide repeat protein [Stigmatella erecta]SEU15811.1 MJ0042 family finger-like domain-containing protein [Stigmatella erecta]
MDVRCDRCKSQYQLEDARIPEAGLTVQCPSCQYVFGLKKKSLLITLPVKPGQEQSSPVVVLGSAASAAASEEGPEPGLPPAGAGERSREWRVRQASGNVFSLKDLTTLQKWIIERKVVRDDEISLTGDSWKRLGDIAELATFFQVLDEAQRASLLQAQMELGKALGTPKPGAPIGGTPASAGNLSPRPQGPVAMRRGSPLPLLVLLLLGAGGAFYYFQVWGPQREEAARAESARQEEERQAQLRAERAAAEASPVAPDAEGGNDPSDAGKALAAAVPPASQDAGSGEDAVELVDVGALPDADAGADAGEAVDAGVEADAGTDLDGGSPPVKRPEPVRDYNYYMAQGNRLRARERFVAAAEAFANAAELEPERAEPYSGRGLALLDLGNPQEAAPEFEQALRLNPRYGEAMIGLAETYRSQGKKAEAIRYYQRYLEILPEGPEAEVARSAIERLMQ